MGLAAQAQRSAPPLAETIQDAPGKVAQVERAGAGVLEHQLGLGRVALKDGGRPPQLSRAKSLPHALELFLEPDLAQLRPLALSRRVLFTFVGIIARRESRVALHPEFLGEIQP